MTDFNVTLAHKKGSKELDLEQGVFVQPKLDGVRCYTRLCEDGEVRMFSRNHKEFKNAKHIITALRPIFDSDPTIILDGELYNHKFKDNFNKIISLVRKTKPSQADRFESASLLQYHIYDCFMPSLPNANYSRRLMGILGLLEEFKPKFVYDVETFGLLYNEDDIQYRHKINKENGYEGSMLRTNTAYEQRRSHGLQKVKDWSDEEFQIRGFVEGKGKFAGGLGKFIGFLCSTGEEVEVPWPDITIEKRKAIWENKDYYYGKIATVEYFEKTPSGALRFPRFKGLRDYE